MSTLFDPLFPCPCPCGGIFCTVLARSGLSTRKEDERSDSKGGEQQRAKAGRTQTHHATPEYIGGCSLWGSGRGDTFAADKEVEERKG
ncbi:hypothetical protein KM043_015776 [Ampulex compressa]|nr:hypothetical protein KM043_015776 [Ampulex compressa]